MANNIGTLLVELGVNTGAFVEGMDKATYKAKQAGKEIGDAFKGIGRDLGGLLSQFGEMGSVIGESLGQAGETLAKMASQFGSVGGAAGAAAIGVSAFAAVAIAAGAGVTAMAIAGAELVHELAMVSAKTGISIQDLQGLQAAGKTVGLSLDAMVTGFRKFDQALLGMGKGGGAAAVVLRNLGVTALTNKEALNEVADAFSKMEDGPRKAADAVALFGRSGLNMIPFLNKGREGLAEFDKLVDEYGPKIGSDAVKANEAYLVSQVKLGLAWDSMKVSLVSGVLPVLSSVLDKLAEIPKVTRIASDAIFHHFGRTLQLMAQSKDADEFHSKVAGAYNNDPEVLAAQDNARLLKKAKEDTTAAAEKEEFTEKQIALRIKDQGAAATALRLEKEKIADLEQAGRYDLAAKEYPKLPGMERAASLEKKQQAYRLDPKETALGADKVQELNSKLDEEIAKQEALARTVGMTANEQAVANAVAQETLKISDEARTLQNEQKKAEAELARLQHDQGTQEYHDAQQRVAFIKQERQELEASTAAMIDKAGKAASIGENTKLAKKIMDERLALIGEAEAWEYLSAAIGKGTEAKIQAEAAAARVKARIENKTPAEVDIAGEKAEQTARRAAEGALLQKKATMDLNAILEQELSDLNAIAASSKDNQNIQLAVAAAEQAAIRKTTSEWDAQAMAVGDLHTKMQAFFNEQVAQGQDLGKKIFDSMSKALDDLSTQLADFVVTGKANFKSLLTGLETGVTKSIMQTGISKMVGGIGGMLGFDASGMMGKPDGTRANPLHTIDVGAPGGASGSMGGALGGMLSKIPVIGSLFGSLGGGGGVGKPDGSQGNPFYMIDASGGGMGGLLGGGDSGGGGGFGSMLSGLSGMFGGFLADGGDVTPGKAYVVGEKHPEFFIPGKSGAVVPTVKTSGSHTTNLSVHFHGVADADSFKKSQSQIAAQFHSQAALAYSRTR